MIIEKIEIDSFASHRGVSIDLAEGLNLIEGSNESGKSSIADFIKFVLYGAGGKAADDHLAERKRVMNFNDSHIAGSLTVRSGGRQIRITRNLAVSGSVRESVRTRVSVRDCETGADLSDGREPGELLLGIPEDLFCASVYLSQRGGAVAGADINQSISNILFSGDERVSSEKAIERIDAARIPLARKHGKVGRIYDIREELASLERKLAEDMEANERIMSLESAVSEQKRTNAEHVANYEQLEKQKRAYQLARSIEQCEAIEGAERAKVESELRMLDHKAEAHIPTDAESDELRAYERSFTALEKRTQELSAERERLELEREGYSGALRFGMVIRREGEDIIDRVENCQKKAKKYTASALALLLTAAAAVGVSFALPAFALYFYIGAFGLADTAIALFCLRAANVKRARAILDAAECKSTDELASALEKYRAASERIAELDAALEENREHTAELRGLFSAEKQRLARFLSDMDAEGEIADSEAIARVSEIFTQRMRTARELEADAREKRAYYEALLTQTKDVDLDAARTELAGLGIADPLSFDIDKLERNIRFYREQSAILSEKIHGLELELTGLRARAVSPAEVKERILALEGELAAAERKLAVYTLATEGLRTASEELRRSVAPTLARISGGYMSTLTDGRYSEMSLDASLSLSYESGGEQRHLDHMSTGTRDMAYLSLRLALADVITGEEGLIVMLDEATAHMDDTRAKNLITLLTERAAEGRQHILFTCHSREAELLSGMGAEFNHIKLQEKEA